MSSIQSFFQNMLYSLPTIGVADILDIAIVALLFYQLLKFVLNSHIKRAAASIVILVVCTLLTDVFNMYATYWILSKVLELGVIALVIVFQPELRRVLERFGSRANFSLFDKSFEFSNEEMVVHATVAACEKMSQEKVGVLLVFERTTALDQYFKTGTVVDALLTEQLLRNLFFPKASLHDGAVIVRSGRVAAAGCVMPLSDSHSLSQDLGTRHRAGVGISEISDAVVVIVSEETGTISVASGGMLKRHLTPHTLEKLLTAELVSRQESSGKTLLEKVRQYWKNRGKKNEEK